MAKRLVKQPNGRLAYFSDIVDNFVYVNLSVSAAREILTAEFGVRTANEKILAAQEDHLPWTVKANGPGDARWKESIEKIEAVHGKYQADKVKKLCEEKPKRKSFHKVI